MGAVVSAIAVVATTLTTVAHCVRSIQQLFKKPKPPQPPAAPITEIEKAVYPKPDWLDIDNFVNWAVAGATGVGKSSLVNAIRGLPIDHKDAAKVGVVECTMECKPYEFYDQRMAGKFRLYDVPGCGTEAHPIATYVKLTGLRYYHGVILVIRDGRPTENDIYLIRECIAFGVPYYIVNNKWSSSLLGLGVWDPAKGGDPTMAGTVDWAREKTSRLKVRQRAMKLFSLGEVEDSSGKTIKTVEGGGATITGARVFVLDTKYMGLYEAQNFISSVLNDVLHSPGGPGGKYIPMLPEVPKPTTAGPALEANKARQLKVNDALRDQELITQEEYNQRRKEILNFRSKL